MTRRILYKSLRIREFNAVSAPGWYKFKCLYAVQYGLKLQINLDCIRSNRQYSGLVATGSVALRAVQTADPVQTSANPFSSQYLA